MGSSIALSILYFARFNIFRPPPRVQAPSAESSLTHTNRASSSFSWMDTNPSMGLPTVLPLGRQSYDEGDLDNIEIQRYIVFHSNSSRSRVREYHVVT